ncbi:MAG: YjbH domain-containing protein, partial [bacterium]
MIRDQKPQNRNTFKFDFVFYPQFYLTNLTFNTIYEVQFNIAPALQLSLWKGMQLTAQVILPIYSDCKVYGEEGHLIRPGFLVLSQDFRLPGPVFGNISIGNFNNHRYGFDFNLMYPFHHPRWDVGFNAGLTGYSTFREDGWDFGNLEAFTFFVSAGYFLPRFSLRFRASAGRFLYGDYGGRFDLTRMFGETAIGFYAAYSMEKSDGAGYP